MVVFETRRQGASLPGLPVCRMGDVPQRHVSTGGMYLILIIIYDPLLVICACRRVLLFTMKKW